MDYINTVQIENKQLYKDILTNEELYKLRVIPVQADRSHLLFGVTTTTSQQTMTALRQRFIEQRVAFAIISDTATEIT